MTPDSLAGAVVTAGDGAHPGQPDQQPDLLGAQAPPTEQAPLDRNALIGKIQAKLDKIGAKRAAGILEKHGVTNLDRTDQSVLDELRRELEK